MVLSSAENRNAPRLAVGHDDAEPEGIELGDNLGHRDVFEASFVEIARYVDNGRRVVRVVGRLLVAGLEEQPVRRSTSERVLGDDAAVLVRHMGNHAQQTH